MADEIPYLTWLEHLIHDGHDGHDPLPDAADIALGHIIAARAALEHGHPIEGLMLTLLASQAHMVADHDQAVARLEARLIRIEAVCTGREPEVS